jgi:formylglycine-generating enzyme required for sulfatase activity
MDGLAGKADEAGNKDGVVSLLELYNHAYLQTTRWVLRNRPGYVQTPELYGRIAGDMVLARRDVVIDPPSMKPPADPPPLAVAPFNATDAKGYQQAWARHLGQAVELTNSIGMKLVLIPAGDFQMGSPESESDRDSDETQHRVRLTKPFYLGMHEVTQAEYERVMGTNPSAFSRSGDRSERVSGQDTSRFPVETVSWEEAVEFCRKLSAMPGERAAGRVYRLPTEAEWEFACRAGTTEPFHFGSQLNGRDANCDGNYPYGTTTKGPYLERPTTVGSYGANGFGLFDMHGNVWEWCSDWYDGYASTAVDDPTGPTSGSNRVLRGGGWHDYARRCRSADRSRHTPDYRISKLGFRLASSSVDQSGQ